MRRKISMFVGEKYPTNDSGDALVLEIIKGRHPKVLVLFEDTNTITLVDKGSLSKGSVSDRNRKTIYGKGYLGYGNYSSSGSNRKAYTVWIDMFTRCYSGNEERFPNYRDVCVCSEWYNFQNFAKWFHDNYVKGYSLDKDLKVLGSKVYSPDTCTFVPLRVNSFITASSKGGVTYHKGAWIAQCAYRVGEDRNNTYLGRFSDKEEAKNVYKKFKRSLAYKLKETYPEVLDDNMLSNIEKMIENC